MVFDPVGQGGALFYLFSSSVYLSPSDYIFEMMLAVQKVRTLLCVGYWLLIVTDILGEVEREGHSSHSVVLSAL